MEIPVTSKELIDKLDELYPVHRPTPKDTQEDIMYKAGQRNVVDMLVTSRDMEEENV